MPPIFTATLAGLVLASTPTGHSYNTEQRQTFDQQRFEGMSRQIAEPSCATASIATILQVQFDVILNEAELWLGYVAQLSPNEQRIAFSNGLSIADIARILGELGYTSYAVRTDLQSMGITGSPAIIFMERGEPAPFRHFVVFVELAGTDVVIFDPAIGRRKMHINEFMRHWTGVAIFVGRGNETNGS